MPACRQRRLGSRCDPPPSIRDRSSPARSSPRCAEWRRMALPSCPRLSPTAPSRCSAIDRSEPAQPARSAPCRWSSRPRPGALSRSPPRGSMASRRSGCSFAAAAFTNLTRDHLDYHGTLDAYFEAKARLFRELLPEGAPAVLNFDDERVAALGRTLRGNDVFGFTRNDAPGASLKARDVHSGLDGVSFHLVREGEAKSIRLQSPLIGSHNVENLLAAVGLLLGARVVEPAALPDLVRAAGGAPGRLERVPDPAGRIVLVDYAHTHDALAPVLDAIRRAGAPRIVCVFGCGGDRDPRERPLIGEAAGRRAPLSGSA